MRSIVNTAFRLYLKYRYKQIEDFKADPIRVQALQLLKLIERNQKCEWGIDHGFERILTVKGFEDQPLTAYEDLQPYIERMMHGEEDVLVSGKVQWFSKSSGTTNSRSKYIPVPEDNLEECHIKGTWDTMAMVYHNNPESKIFHDRSLLMGGSITTYDALAETYVGDISAIMIKNMPIVGRPFHTPDFETALMNDWEAKIERMASIVAQNKDLVMFGGVPTWVIVLFERILEKTGKQNMLEVWPHLECYVHGGVGFRPYRDRFRSLIPSDDFQFVQVYNATEGYFAVQEFFGQEDMLLLLDNGMYYEFIPLEQVGNPHPDIIPLAEVETAKHYAIVITTSAGLWRYQPGDTVIFTETFPFRIQVTGRTKQYVNAFGEEVIVDNTDKAIAETCSMLDAQVTDYTVGPKYFEHRSKAAHEWILEFEREPRSMDDFNIILDRNLKRLNSDYEAKRTKDLALTLPTLHSVPKNTFNRWLKSKGKLGGQHKVPRLANDRTYIDEILQFAASNQK